MSEGRSSDERERARLERERRRLGAIGDTPPPPPLPPPSAPTRLAPPAPPVHRDDDPGEALMPPRDGRAFIRRRVMLAIIALSALVVAWSVLSVFQPFSGDGRGEGAVRVQIPRGADVGEIGEILADEKIVGNASVFGWRAGL